MPITKIAGTDTPNEGRVKFNDLITLMVDDGLILSGSGAPASSLGDDGQYYFDTSNGDFYQKNSGSWSVVVNLQGADGDITVSNPSDGDAPVWDSGSSSWLGEAVALLAGATFTGDIAAPNVNGSTALKEGGTVLSSIYAALSGATFTGTVNVSSGQLQVAGDRVAEYGSNSNGEYVRFYNGVQVCWLRDTQTPGGSSDTLVTGGITWPAAFSATPRAALLSVEPSGGGAQTEARSARYIFRDDITTTFFRYVVYQFQGSTLVENLITDAIGIGTWS